MPGVTDLLGLRIFLRLLVVEGGDNMGVVIFELSLNTLCTGDWITLSVFGRMKELVAGVEIADTRGLC